MSKVRSRTGWNGIRQIYNHTKVCKVKSTAVKEQALQRLYVSTYLDREQNVVRVARKTYKTSMPAPSTAANCCLRWYDRDDIPLLLEGKK
jgi:hypothetical protein